MNLRPVRLALDVMGGDHGPTEVCRGALLAARDLPHGSKIVLVGDASAMGRLETASRPEGVELEITHTADVIGPNDRPSDAFRKKPNASVALAAKLVKDGKADAFVSIGNTGAAMAAALLHLQRVPGIDRPAITAAIPTLTRPTVMLDMGANVDCEPHQLAEFAVMGLVYCKTVLGRENPSVALLSNGSEDCKGNSLTRRAHRLLAECLPEFIGNIEAREVFYGKADVVVCDGFDGNVMLKCAEGVAMLVLSVMKEELTRHPWMRLALLPLRPAMRRIGERLDYRAFGGAPLLGVNGVCVIGHGSSDALAVSNALRVASASVGHALIDAIREAAQDLRKRRAALRENGVAGATAGPAACGGS